MAIKRECWVSTNHPELKDGECLLGNTPRSEKYYIFDISGDELYEPTLQEHYDRISLKSKRKGNIAYDVKGNICEHLYPIFVNIDEYENYLIQINNLDKCRQATIDKIQART